MKTSELTGPALDWAVAKCDQPQWSDEDALLWVQDDEYQYNPSIDWSHGGPIIERETIELYKEMNRWAAIIRVDDEEAWELYGSTPLVAAMRCFVASKMGDEVEVPADLED